MGRDKRLVPATQDFSRTENSSMSGVRTILFPSFRGQLWDFNFSVRSKLSSEIVLLKAKRFTCERCRTTLKWDSTRERTTNYQINCGCCKMLKDFFLVLRHVQVCKCYNLAAKPSNWKYSRLASLFPPQQHHTHSHTMHNITVRKK